MVRLARTLEGCGESEVIYLCIMLNALLDDGMDRQLMLIDHSAAAGGV
jgi:hypothetical protein